MKHVLRMCSSCATMKQYSEFRFIKLYRAHRKICQACELAIRADKKRNKIKHVKETGLTPKIYAKLMVSAYDKADVFAEKKILQSLCDNEIKKLQTSDWIDRTSGLHTFVLIASIMASILIHNYISISVLVLTIIYSVISSKYQQKYIAPIRLRIQNERYRILPDYFQKLKSERMNYQNSLKTTEWRVLQKNFLNKHHIQYGNYKCNYCNKILLESDVTVDHFYPRSKYPELTLVESNLRISCRRCNSSKGNRLVI